MAVYRWNRAGLGLLTAVSLVLAGCSADGERAEKEEKEKKTLQVEEKHKIRNITVSTAWKTSKGKVMAHGAAEIKNTGKKPVQLDSARIQFLGKDDRILAEQEILAVVPKILQPGESAYIGQTVHLKGAKSTKELQEVILDTDDIPTYIPPVKLETESLTHEKNGKDSTTVTGNVKNPNSKRVESVFVTTALKNKQGNLIAVISDYLDPGIPAGGQAKFRAHDDKLPTSLTKQATQLEAQAYPVFEGKQK